MELFDIVKALFSRDEYKNVTDSEKKKHFFMIQRFMSIKYPLQAYTFGCSLEVNPVAVVDLWHMMIMRGLPTRVPEWIYTKANKSADKKAETVDKIFTDKELTLAYCRRNEIGITEFNMLIDFYPSELKNELTTLKQYV